MAFNPFSYFAGIGTVFVAVAVGFGGGLLMTNSPSHRADPPNRLERLASSAPLASPSQAQTPAAPAPAEPGPPTPAPTASVASAPRAVDLSPPASPEQASAVAQPATAPAADAAPAASQKSAAAKTVAANDPPASVRDTAARQPDPEAEARKVAERRQAERHKWAERKRKQQELEAATVEVRRVGRDDDTTQDAVQREVIEAPRLGFFGQ
jgi:hypothetical protein